MKSSHILPHQQELNAIADKINKEIHAANSKLIAMKRNTCLQEEYLLFSSNLQEIQDKFSKLTDVAFEIDSYQTISKQLEILILKIHETIAPEQIAVTNKLYNQTIKQICFRGDEREPTTDSGDGIFQLGFSKTKLNREYQEWVDQFYYEQRYSNDIRVIRPLAINRATTNSTSKDPRSAAFFPIAFKLTKLSRDKVFTSLQKELDQLNILINVRNDYISFLNTESNQNNLLLLRKDSYSESQKKLLISILKRHLGENESNNAFIDKLLLKIESDLFAELKIKDTSWIYVVYVDNGFPVSDHAYSYASLNKFSNHQYYSFFAQEICTDEIIPKHVIAAVEISRDFTNMRLDKESMKLAGRFHGGAEFRVNKMIYNEQAMDYFKSLGIDVNKYKELLDKYFKNEVYHSINLSDDGYKRSFTLRS